MLAAGLLAQPAFADPGDLDTGWDMDGKLLADEFLRIPDMAVQSDGKPLAVWGNSGDLSVVRYNTDGSLDTSFDGDGRASIDPGGFEQTWRVAIQPDGKIVVVGNADTNQGDFAVARFNANGTPDTSFNGTGFVTTDIGANSSDGARGVAIQSDGKIVVAGTSDSDWAVVRYTSTGGLDTSFGTGSSGKVVLDLGSNFDDVTGVGIQSGGRIVVGGETATGGTDFDLVVAGFTSAGVLDSSYGAAGIRTADFGTNDDQASGFAMQSDGKAIVIGNRDNDSFALARFDATGALDTSFDGDGKVETGFLNFTEGHAVAVQQNGRIVAVGITDNGACCDFAVARYEANGSLDTTFSGDGKVTTSFGSDDSADATAINPADGRIYAGGTTPCCGEGSQGAIAAYLGDPPPPPPPPQQPPPEQPPPEQPPPEQPPPDPCANDKTGPTITITSNQDKALYQQRETPASVAIAASDASGLANNPSDPSRTLSTKTIGLQTITVTARDNCNNETTRTFRYRVAGDPQIGIAGVRAACTTSNFLARITITSDVSLRSVTVRLDGKPIAQGKGRRLTVKIPIKRLSEGRHVITIQARDRAGNRTTERANFARCVTVTPHFTG